jgi:flagellar biosynthesis protein FliQ
MYAQAATQLVQSALVTALWVSLPLLLAIVAAGLLAGYLQSAVGQPDPVTLFAPRLLGAALALLALGSWMLAFTAQYWVALWGQAGPWADRLAR